MTSRLWPIALLLLTAPLAAEEIRPDTGVNAVAVVNNGCTVSTAHGVLDDDPQSPGGDWCACPDNNNTSIHVRFNSPSGDLSTGTDAQTFRVYLRRDAATAPGNGEPTIALDAYDNGVLEDADEAAGTVTSDTGQLYTETWTSSTATGTNIEVNMVCTAAGGGPNQRSCDFESVEWDATLASGRRLMIIGEIKRDDRRAAR